MYNKVALQFLPMAEPEVPRRVGSKRRPASPRARRRWLQHLLVFITALLVVNALVGERGLLETWRVEREYKELAASVLGVRRENARLREEARRLRDDPRAIEEAARRDLGLIRPGEVLFTVRDEPALDARPAEPK